MSNLTPYAPDRTPAGWRWRALHGISLCALAPGAVGGDGTTDHFLPVAMALAAFTAAGVWMFRRWGDAKPVEVPGPRPAPAPRPRTTA